MFQLAPWQQAELTNSMNAPEPEYQQVETERLRHSTTTRETVDLTVRSVWWSPAADGDESNVTVHAQIR